MGSRENPRKVISKLQTDLNKANKEISKLKRVIQDLKKGKDRLIPISEHRELLKKAEERASRAEMKAIAFESELNKKGMNGLYKSSPILAEAHGSRLSEPEGKAPIPPHSAGGGKTKGRPPNGKHSPRASPRFHRRVSASRKNDFGSDLRRLSSASVTSRRASSKRRQQSLQKQLELSMKKKKRQLTGGKESKPPKTLLSRMLKSNGHKSKPAANQNKAKRVRSDDNWGGNNTSPGHHRQSLLMRVHTRLFSKRKKLRSIYDLPDLSNLADCNFTKEYETPRECFHRFEKTPLIVAEGESDEDSGWSTSEEEEKVGAQRQTRRTKAKSDKKPNKKIKGSKKDTPPPVAPKPKNPSTSVSNTSLTPPSSPTNSEEKILHQSTFDEIPGQRPLKSYHRVHGPHGRRRPVRYSYLTATDTTENGV
ncbi:uncharacterized protein [Apostichopus japonicus]|uniref:uncharacterized protein n=1 Tax=Stichopus japonicus TaxID=307972 RepID=UPI003AB7B911